MPIEYRHFGDRTLPGLARWFEEEAGKEWGDAAETEAEWYAHVWDVSPGFRTFMRASQLDGRLSLTQLLYFSVNRWRNWSYPIYEITEAFLSRAVLTDVGNVPAEDVQWPFPTFGCALPAGFWHSYSKGVAIPIRSMLFSTVLVDIPGGGARVPGSVLWLFGGGGFEIHAIQSAPHCGASLRDWIDDGVDQPLPDSFAAESLPLNSTDLRMVRAARQLVVNLALLATARPHEVERRGPAWTAPRKSRQHTMGTGVPERDPVVYLVSRKIKLDPSVVAAARAWTDPSAVPQRALWYAGKRHVVRGHWWRCHIGAREEGRVEWRWVQPYVRNATATEVIQHIYTTGTDGGAP